MQRLSHSASFRPLAAASPFPGDLERTANSISPPPPFLSLDGPATLFIRGKLQGREQECGRKVKRNFSAFSCCFPLFSCIGKGERWTPAGRPREEKTGKKRERRFFFEPSSFVSFEFLSFSSSSFFSFCVVVLGTDEELRNVRCFPQFQEISVYRIYMCG